MFVIHVRRRRRTRPGYPLTRLKFLEEILPSESPNSRGRRLAWEFSPSAADAPKTYKPRFPWGAVFSPPQPNAASASPLLARPFAKPCTRPVQPRHFSSAPGNRPQALLVAKIVDFTPSTGVGLGFNDFCRHKPLEQCAVKRRFLPVRRPSRCLTGDTPSQSPRYRSSEI